MVKSIEQFVAADGETFATLEEAERHEHIIRITPDAESFARVYASEREADGKRLIPQIVRHVLGWEQWKLDKHEETEVIPDDDSIPPAKTGKTKK